MVLVRWGFHLGFGLLEFPVVLHDWMHIVGVSTRAAWVTLYCEFSGDCVFCFLGCFTFGVGLWVLWEVVCLV